MGLLLFPGEMPATGIEDPLRWIIPREKSAPPAVLAAPEFFFEAEVKRIAAELYPDTKPEPTAETTEADLADFQEAVAKNVIAPPEPEKAEAAHRATRARLDWESLPEGDRPAEPPLPEEFPSEFADYHRAVHQLAHTGREAAVAEWKKLLERPPAERHYRTTWALYMLGKFAQEDGANVEAHAWYTKVRQAVGEGFADSVGLAGASHGWEAYLHLHAKNYPEAARHYFAQLAGGKISAVISLRVVMTEAISEGADLPADAKDPFLQRLLTSGALCGMGPFARPFGNEKDETADRWLAALESADAKNVRDADRVAWISYSQGDYAGAQRWLARADGKSPYALWLKAKFALRDGKVDAATKLLSAAVEGIPEIAPIEAYSVGWTVLRPHQSALADLAVLRLGRAEFIAALRMFLAAGLTSDANYLADGVLTIEELKNFLKTHEFPEPTEESGDPAAELHQVLTSRLVRLGRYAEARPLMGEPAQELLDRYVAQLEIAKKKGASKAEQAAAYWQAAKIMWNQGSLLVDYFDPVTMARRSSGREIETGSYPEISIKYGEAEKNFPPLTKAERDRLKANSKPELRRHYSNYLAADLGMRSAALMPDNDEVTARRLNTIGGWLKNGDEQAADRFYQAIERRCPKTKIGAAAIKRHWFVPDEVEDVAE
jgi:tetratricopeptide (TPR) repeat protein